MSLNNVPSFTPLESGGNVARLNRIARFDKIQNCVPYEDQNEDKEYV
jgi:hypothetical protein